jgi:hypothetical protein
MNERIESPSPVEPRVIDRLVDGELTAGEERNLLAAIDFQPDGWRRCALAFLEARAWKDEMAFVAHDAGRRFNGAPMNGTLVAVLPPMPRTARAQWARVFAVAACVGLAFFLGIVVRGQWTQRGNDISDQLAGTGRATQGDLTKLDVAGVRFASKPSITMAVVDNQGDVERQFELPVVEADRLNPGWLARRPAAVSPQEVEALKDFGYRVDQERLYVPVLLDDGRQAIVSFDRAAVKYSGWQY